MQYQETQADGAKTRNMITAISFLDGPFTIHVSGNKTLRCLVYQVWQRNRSMPHKTMIKMLTDEVTAAKEANQELPSYHDYREFSAGIRVHLAVGLTFDTLAETNDFIPRLFVDAKGGEWFYTRGDGDEAPLSLLLGDHIMDGRASLESLVREEEVLESFLPQRDETRIFRR